MFVGCEVEKSHHHCIIFCKMLQLTERILKHLMQKVTYYCASHFSQVTSKVISLDPGRALGENTFHLDIVQLTGYGLRLVICL